MFYTEHAISLILNVSRIHIFRCIIFDQTAPDHLMLTIDQIKGQYLSNTSYIWNSSSGSHPRNWKARSNSIIMNNVLVRKKYIF